MTIEDIVFNLYYFAIGVWVGWMFVTIQNKKGRKMKIYVASSWRNLHQPEVVRRLRAEAWDVYDFRNPCPGDHGFSWRQCATPEQLKDGKKFRDEVLTHPVAQAGFRKDMDALATADATVLVLPCGRSAHLELGYATGKGQDTIVLLDSPMSEPELMYLACDRIATSLDEVVEMLHDVDFRKLV